MSVRNLQEFLVRESYGNEWCEQFLKDRKAWETEVMSDETHSGPAFVLAKSGINAWFARWLIGMETAHWDADAAK